MREQAPEVYDEILYLEQPTERYSTAQRWDLRPLAQYKPVLIDESLATVEDFALALELGWWGIALKSCKCLSSDLLFVPMAELNRIPYAVQDLTNPSIALIESVGLAADPHDPGGRSQFAANSSRRRTRGGGCPSRALSRPQWGGNDDDLAWDRARSPDRADAGACEAH